MPGGSLRRSIVRLVPWTIAAAAALALLVSRVRPAAVGDAHWGLADVVTGASEMTTLQLRDGSVVRLAPSSRLRIATTDSIREVELEGRAFFAVAKMQGRPFVVRTRAGNATVLGTRFEIVTERDDLRLLVVEGRVALSTGRHRVEVSAGEVSGVRDSATITPTRVADANRMEKWVGKFLVFQATPMRDAARQIERMYRVRITTDSTIASRTVTATFTDQTAEQVLDVVCSVMHAQCVQRGGELVMSQKP
jgi:transmembrane sensor